MSERNLNVNGDPIPDEVANTLHQRDEQWGDTYKRVANMFNLVTGNKLTTGDFITLMLCLKLLRWKHSDYKDDDSLVDIIGYARLGMTKNKEKVTQVKQDDTKNVAEAIQSLDDNYISRMAAIVAQQKQQQERDNMEAYIRHNFPFMFKD